MNSTHLNFIATLLQSTFADRPTQTVSEWCMENLWFDEPDNRGPFSLLGREYARACLDDFADPNITDQVLVFGSQAGKTVIIMGGTAWIICNEASRVFWVMPTQDLVRKFSSTRWSQFLRASPAMNQLIPTGAQRHAFSTFQQRIGTALVDFTWSNSPSALSSTPARVINLDEMDKFQESTAKEADAVDLAEQRAKSFANPKRTKTSTPTIVEGLIWQEFLKSDQQRRFLPCPSCSKLVVFAWSKQFTVFPIVGNEAFAKWDKEAKRVGGMWDLDRVERSARYECPHCGFHIQDAHKTIMDRSGVWMPIEKRVKCGNTELPASRGYRGRHLPSLYAPSSQCNVGKLAVKFLQKQDSLLGLQGFINGDLAEPFESQDTKTERIEIITRTEKAPDGGTKILTSDVQEKSPHFWYVVMHWLPGLVKVIDAGSCGTEQELRDIQINKHGIAENHVGLDERWDTDRVRELCSRFGVTKMTEKRKAAKQPPLHVGWMPVLGVETDGWMGENKSKSLFHLQPLDRRLGGKVIALPRLEIADDLLKDVLARLRKGKVRGMRLEFDESICNEEFWRHLDGERKMPIRSKITGRVHYKWVLRSRHWPNHLLDAVKMNLGMALFHRVLIDVGDDNEPKADK